MRYKTITSGRNPAIKEALKIKARRDKPQMRGVMLIEGPHLIEMALSAGASISKAFFTEGFAGRKDGRRLIQGLVEAEAFKVPEDVLSRLSETETPQGIAAICSIISRRLNEITFKGNALIAVSDGVSDPGNLGAIIRTSDAAGADAAVILSGSSDAFSPKALRASHGSIFNIPVVGAEKKAFIEWAQKNGISLAVTHQRAEVSIYEADLTGPIAFAFGNESSGISEEIRKAADMELRIPIFGKAESLNVGHSAAVCLYEAVRERISLTTEARREN